MAALIIKLIICFALFCFCCWGIYNRLTYSEKQKEEIEKKIQTAQKETNDIINRYIGEMRHNYYSIRGQLSIPLNCSKVDVETTVFGLPCKAIACVGDLNLLLNDFYIWTENDTLYIFPTEDHLQEKHITYRTLPKDLYKVLKGDDIQLYKIDIKNINYYKIVGDERTETQIHTNNTGVNVKGAVMGGIIAGEAGAIIGSQHNRNNVYSTTRHYDERYVELYYSSTSNIKKIKLSITSYPLFESWFPEKEYSFTLTNNTQEDTNSFNEIKKYKELLDADIIAELEKLLVYVGKIAILTMTLSV